MYPANLGDILETSFEENREHLSSSSPGSTLEDNDSTGSQYGVDLSGKTTNLAGKSFTIAAILGLRGASDDDVMNLSVQERYGMEDRFSGFQNKLAGHKHFEEYFLARKELHERVYNNSYNSNGEKSQDATSIESRLQQTTNIHKQPKLGLHSCSNANSSRNKRIRTIFTPEQLERLEAEFERQQYMVGPERLYLAHALHLTEAQVKVWFQNRRIKWRKHHLEMTQQRLAVLQRHRTDNENEEDID